MEERQTLVRKNEHTWIISMSVSRLCNVNGRIGDDLEGSSHDPIKVLARHLPLGAEEYHVKLGHDRLRFKHSIP
jgi:hypothetical protein